jgi:hypothetical protein
MMHDNFVELSVFPHRDEFVRDLIAIRFGHRTKLITGGCIVEFEKGCMARKFLERDE